MEWSGAKEYWDPKSLQVVETCGVNDQTVDGIGRKEEEEEERKTSCCNAEF